MQKTSSDNAQTNKIDKGTLITVFIAVVIIIVAFLLRIYVFTSFITQGASMEPSYQNGQRVWVHKTDNIARGDVIVILDSVSGEYLLKRVIAFEGDCLRAVTLDGENYRIQIKYKGTNEWIDEEYEGVAIPLVPKDFNFYEVLGCIPTEGEYVVKQGVFLIGDNRLISSDSRSRGEFDLSHLQGKVINK